MVQPLEYGTLLWNRSDFHHRRSEALWRSYKNKTKQKVFDFFSFLKPLLHPLKTGELGLGNILVFIPESIAAVNKMKAIVIK
jgi:hypothetical protein